MRRVSIALAAALLLAGCSGAPASSAPPSSAPPARTSGAGSRHAAADIDFVRALIPHHEQGITLARAVASRPGARTLAEAIVVTQQDEVARMRGWLREWSAAPATGAGPVASSGAASTAPPTPGDPVRALIAHQEEAIRLAQQEQANGTNPTALAFAKQIIESRTAEIEQLGGLG